ncbi:hypothetical protein ACLOJK_015436 [Asimina triloba]
MAEKQGELEEKEKEKEKKHGKKRKWKEAFIYGNYRSYYGYRIGQSMSEDPRLALMKKEWFEGKDCLDIGCNQGLVTVAVATKFCCRSILGVDIDGGLIENANWNLKRIARMENSGGKSINPRTKDLLERANGQDHSASLNEVAADVSKDLSISEEPTVLKRVSFKEENIVQNLNPCREKYDTILCLSVTKWIHLNWGDEGLIDLFVKIWRLLRPEKRCPGPGCMVGCIRALPISACHVTSELGSFTPVGFSGQIPGSAKVSQTVLDMILPCPAQPGGILILEPQPWKSYKSKHKVSEVTRHNFAQILFKPRVFQEILLDMLSLPICGSAAYPVVPMIDNVWSLVGPTVVVRSCQHDRFPTYSVIARITASLRVKWRALLTASPIFQHLSPLFPSSPKSTLKISTKSHRHLSFNQLIHPIAKIINIPAPLPPLPIVPAENHDDIIQIPNSLPNSSSTVADIIEFPNAASVRLPVVEKLSLDNVTRFVSISKKLVVVFGFLYALFQLLSLPTAIVLFCWIGGAYIGYAIYFLSDEAVETALQDSLNALNEKLQDALNALDEKIIQVADKTLMSASLRDGVREPVMKALHRTIAAFRKSS